MIYIVKIPETLNPEDLVDMREEIQGIHSCLSFSSCLLKERRLVSFEEFELTFNQLKDNTKPVMVDQKKDCCLFQCFYYKLGTYLHANYPVESETILANRKFLHDFLCLHPNRRRSEETLQSSR